MQLQLAILMFNFCVVRFKSPEIHYISLDFEENRISLTKLQQRYIQKSLLQLLFSRIIHSIKAVVQNFIFKTILINVLNASILYNLGYHL